MSEDKESKQKLIECAKKEFLEKGFVKASLRKISSDAGLTTGAVYFFFKDKNGLLGAIVDRPLEQIYSAISQHFAEDLETDMSLYQQTDGDHKDLLEALVPLLYSDREAMLILLNRAQGSAYENVVETFIDMLDKTYFAIAENYAKVFTGKKVNEYAVHWLSHLTINAFVHLIIHETDEKSAMKNIEPIMDYIVKGYVSLMLTDI